MRLRRVSIDALVVSGYIKKQRNCLNGQAGYCDQGREITDGGTYPTGPFEFHPSKEVVN